jgi:LuxR family maltose regulon positive regulatory protein
MFGDAPVAPRAASPTGAGGTSAPVEPLSDRELELLQLIAAGRKNREIADALVISVNTVKVHIGNIYGKLGVSNRVQAVARAQELALL